MMEALFTWFLNQIFSALLLLLGIDIDVSSLFAGFGV